MHSYRFVSRTRVAIDYGLSSRQCAASATPPRARLRAKVNQNTSRHSAVAGNWQLWAYGHNKANRGQEVRVRGPHKLPTWQTECKGQRGAALGCVELGENCCQLLSLKAFAPRGPWQKAFLKGICLAHKICMPKFALWQLIMRNAQIELHAEIRQH